MNIRLATPEDAAAIAAFNNAMALETEGITLEPEVALAGVLAVLHHKGHGFYLLAEKGHEAIGSLMITYEWSDWRNRNKWWIQSVYVRPDMRGRGIFAALYQRVLEEAKAHHVADVYLYVDAGNKSAQAVYEKLGMERSHYVMFEKHV